MDTAYSTDEDSNACKVLVGKSEGNRPLGRHTRRWEDNINIDIGEKI
jgi:hypothetical protein